MSILKANNGIKTHTIADKLRGDRSVLILEINGMIEMRGKWKITQEVVAQNCGVSLATVKRFEAFKVDSLSLYWNYKQLFY
jgi:DNA-binding XRE family transcriptional regulator